MCLDINIQSVCHLSEPNALYGCFTESGGSCETSSVTFDAAGEAVWLISDTVLPVLADVDVDDLTKRIYKFFGAGTVYDLPLNDPYRKKGGTGPVHLTTWHTEY